MNMQVGYGNTSMGITLPEENLIAVLEPKAPAAGLIGQEEVRRALQAPIGTPKLGEIVRPGETVAIITSDISRPCPTYKMLPPVLEELYAAGIRPEDITLVFALGSHRRHTPEEQRKLAGDQAWEQIKLRDGDPNDCVHVGVTAHGTPVDIDRVVAQADRRICLGNIEYHYFAGYSGGAKAIMPGVSTRAAIQENHSMMVREEARAGLLEGNPVRMDLEEAARLVGVDFILNVVLDAHKEIIHAVAGDMVEAHRAGCKFLDSIYRSPIPQRADIVVVSQGGAPKDLNLYQVQKALDNAKHAVKKGGTVVLVGSCREGLGEGVFQEWMMAAQKPEDLVERIQKEFRLGGHKAAAIALVLQNADILLVSDMPDDLVRDCFMVPYKTAQQALDAAFAKQGKGASVIVMPYGGSTLPQVM